MKSKLLVSILLTLVLSGCEQKNAAIQNEIRIIEKTAKDTTQSESIRKGAGVFAKILSEEQGIPDRNLMSAHGTMMGSRNATTIATYVAFLKALEKKLPDQLPSPEDYQAMKAKAGSATVVEYNAVQTVIMMSNSIENITLYNDPAADAEVAGVLNRLTEKHGASETGKKILTFLNLVREQCFRDRARGIKPWESPKRAEGAID